MKNQTPISIIVADDEVAIRNGLQKIVQIDPYTIDIIGSADNGKTAYDMITQHQPDIVVIDINMPEMDGLEVIRQCMEQELSTRFLVLSGYDDFSYAQTAICYGVKYYFLKPLNIAEFRKQFVKQCEEVLAEKHNLPTSNAGNLDVVLSSSKLLFLNELISGRLYESEAMIDTLSKLYLTIKNTRSCTVIFEFDKDHPISKEDLKDINDLIIQTEFKDFPLESWVYDSNRIVAIFNTEDNHALRFRYKINQCVKSIDSLTNSPVLVGIGSMVDNLEATQLSFGKAQEAITYHIYAPDNKVFDTSMINDSMPTFSKDNVDVVPLVEAIINDHKDGILNYCDLFFDSLFFSKTPQPNFLFGMCIYLIMEVHKHLNTRFPELALSMSSTIDMINSFKSATSLRHWVADTLCDYPGKIKQYQKDSNQLIQKAKTYIQDNLQNNIKAKDVAAHVNLSTSYFTIYFKETTGENFRDYLLREKMKMAMALLNKKDSNIGEVANMIGYQDYRSFSRAFKNAVGMSPSKYCNTTH